MIDLKAARNDPDAWRTALARKGAADAFDRLLAADEAWRALVPRIDELRSRTKLKGKPTPEQLAELQGVKEELREAEEALAAAETERDTALAEVPNPPHPSAPDGSADEDAETLREVGAIPELDDPKEHTEVGRFDMERAARLSGSRFGYLIGDTALLAMSLYRFALDHLSKAGFTPMLPPVLVREEAMYGSGFFPTERSNIYALEGDDLYLTGTSEVALAGLHMGEIIDADQLPLRYAAFSPCFRREAGAAGKDTRGMFRVHQFNKVEMFVFVRPEDSWDEHERMVATRGGVPPAARSPLPRGEHRRGRSRRSCGEEDRPRGLVPTAGPLPRGHVVLEHDRLPGAAPRDPPARRARPRAAAHAERDDGHRPCRARDPRELPGRRPGRAEAVRRARADRALAASTSRAPARTRGGSRRPSARPRISRPHRARHAARSSDAARSTAATASSSPATRSPVTPSSTISGIDPRAYAMTGVPQSIDSTTESPNGSSKWIGCRSAAALPSTSARRSGPTEPR